MSSSDSSAKVDVLRATMSSSKSSAKVDVLRATVSDLRSLLESGTVTSLDLVDIYLAQIEKHDRKGANLHAMVSLVHRNHLDELAKKLDDERSRGVVRGPLHGIPIIVKDHMCTGPELMLPTTLGTFAFRDSIAAKNAACVDKFLDAGAIPLGKANLAVMGDCKGSRGNGGLSEIAGQCQSAYVKGGFDPNDTGLGHSTPAGSSCGSAVAVSAGFAPMSIGTDTDGSIAGPADRASLYGMKPTVGLLSTKGILPLSPFADAPGPFAKSSQDLADMLAVWNAEKGTDYSKSLKRSWSGLSVGFINPREWKYDPRAVKPMRGFVDQLATETEEVIDQIFQQTSHVKKWVNLSHFDFNGFAETFWDGIIFHDYARNFKRFVSENFKESAITDMQGLVDFDNEHPELWGAKGPDHIDLITALKHADDLTRQEYEATCKSFRLKYQEAIDKTMENHGVDLIVGPPTQKFHGAAAAAGYPSVTLPLGYSKQNGRAFGLMGVAKANREDLLLELASAWETSFGERWMPPPQLSVNAAPSIWVIILVIILVCIALFLSYHMSSWRAEGLVGLVWT